MLFVCVSDTWGEKGEGESGVNQVLFFKLTLFQFGESCSVLWLALFMMGVIVWAWAELISAWMHWCRSEKGYAKGCMRKPECAARHSCKRLPTFRQWPLQVRLTKDRWCGWANSSWQQADKIHSIIWKLLGVFPTNESPSSWESNTFKRQAKLQIQHTIVFSSAKVKAVFLFYPSLFLRTGGHLDVHIHCCLLVCLLHRKR